MTDTKPVTDVVPPAGHNGGRVINTTSIREFHNALLPLENQINELKEEVRERRQLFKADTGMALADFDAGRRLAMIDDDEARNTKLDNLRAVFDTLAMGEQSDMFVGDE